MNMTVMGTVARRAGRNTQRRVPFSSWKARRRFGLI
eukprot:SAG22_NODE_11326_length_490_cov_0.920716_1_plen_35_part_10